MSDAERKTDGRAGAEIRTVVLKSRQPVTRISFPRFCVVGTYADNGPADFVRHAALLKEEGELNSPVEVEVYHMGPPIIAGELTGARARSWPRKCRADIVSNIALDAEEREAIEDWLAEVDKEDRTNVKPFGDFVVMPHVKWIVDAVSGRRIRRRFSCVGFVIECYRTADIDLIDVESKMPDVDEPLVQAAYPEVRRIEADDRLKERCGFTTREDLGLDGNGPWPIVLAGYVFHSLKRANAENPRPPAYVPQSVSEGCFPG